MAKNPRRSSSKRAQQQARRVERTRLAEREKHAATGPDQDKSLWEKQIQRRRDESFAVASGSALPSRTFGPTDHGHKPDWSSDDEVTETLNRLGSDPESIDPEVMRRVHQRLMDRRTRLVEQRGELDDQISDFDSEVERLYLRVVDDLQQLVDDGRLDAAAVEPENMGKTIALLSSLRLEHGELANHPDLRELMQAADAESEFCEDCDRVYPKGTHRHGEETKILPPQKMNGERICDSAELLTLNQLANFSAFEKTIPLDIIAKLDPTGTNLIGFRSHGNTTRGVKGRDYFRCEALVKLRGRDKPWIGKLDVIPAWFIRLDEGNLEEGSQTATMDLPYSAFPEGYEGKGGLARLATEGLHVTSRSIKTEVEEPTEIPVHVISDDEMDRLIQESTKWAHPEQTKELAIIARDRGLPDYRALGKFEAWALLATNPDPQVVRARFNIALRAVRRAGPDRQFTEMHVDEAIMEWREAQG
jgi:hypothetical protein